jgi:hypothetical protein
VNRRFAYVLAALIIPGGLFILIGAAVFRAFAQSGTGRRACDRIANLWRRPESPVSPFATVQRAA